MIGKSIYNYKILSKIAEGGMGVVYLAEDTKLKRKVALKFLPPDLMRERQTRLRFQREAQAAAALNHPNIVTIYEIDEYQNQIYLAMEYVKGETLKNRFSNMGKPVLVEDVFDIFTQIGEGLKTAHDAGIFHRDIKPLNIMVNQDDKVKILDFGLAKIKGASPLTKQITTLGTIHYMSPEQHKGANVDHRSDLWSLGIVLYEALTGQLPFKGDHPHSVIYSILNNQAQKITILRSDLPLAIELIINKALNKDPDQRYQSADQFLSDLNNLKTKIKSGLQTYMTAPPSIAVLPFTDMSAQKDQEYFCDGIAEELINALAHIRDLRVVARTSAFAFKGRDTDVREIGKRLNVDSILEGSIRKSGNHLRITAQLINVSDGFHIWSERFDRELENIFLIQDEISFAIVDALKVKLLGAEKEKIKKHYTENLEAYNLYLKGIFHQNKFSINGSKKALEYFQQAAEKDTKFVLAYVGIANAYGNLGTLSNQPPEDVLPKSKQALQIALEIDDSLSDAHAANAVLAFFYEWNWQEADKGFKKALSLNPMNAYAHGWYAWYLLAMGKFNDAVKEVKKAQEIDPLMPLYYAFAIAIYGYHGKFSQSTDQFHKAIELDPNLAIAYMHVGSTYLSQNQTQEAIQSLKKAIELSTGSCWAEGVLAATYAVTGEKDQARQILAQLMAQRETRYISPFILAFVLYYLGEKDKSLEWFEKAFQEGDILMALSKVILGLEEVRMEPKFQTILKKMKLI